MEYVSSEHQGVLKEHEGSREEVWGSVRGYLSRCQPERLPLSRLKLPLNVSLLRLRLSSRIAYPQKAKNNRLEERNLTNLTDTMSELSFRMLYPRPFQADFDGCFLIFRKKGQFCSRPLVPLCENKVRRSERFAVEKRTKGLGHCLRSKLPTIRTCE